MDDLEFEKYIDELINDFGEDDSNMHTKKFFTVEKDEAVYSKNTISPPADMKKDIGFNEDKLNKIEKQIQELYNVVLEKNSSEKVVEKVDEANQFEYYKEKINFLESKIAVNKQQRHEMVKRLKQIDSKSEKFNEEINYLKSESELSNCEIKKLNQIIKDLRKRNGRLAELIGLTIKENKEIKISYEIKRKKLENKIKYIIQLVNDER